jgi:hypothetical protein
LTRPVPGDRGRSKRPDIGKSTVATTEIVFVVERL